MLTKMKKALNQSEISAASVLNLGRHKSIDVSILYQDEDDTDHLARNECLHHNPNNKRGTSSDSGLGFICPVQKQRTSEGAVQGRTAIVPIVPQVATAVVPQASIPMMPQSATVPRAAPGSDFDSMMPMLQMMMMQQMMKMIGGNQQPMMAPMQQPMAAQFQQPMAALVQQPTMAPMRDDVLWLLYRMVPMLQVPKMPTPLSF